MTPEELMQPRYRVIADYPDSPLEVGSIFTQRPKANNTWVCSHNNFNYGSETVPRFHQYPHIFKRLKWWEEREVEDMPEYVYNSGYSFSGTKRPKGFYCVKQHFMPAHGEYCCLTTDNWIMHYPALKPATKEQYDAYLATQNQS